MVNSNWCQMKLSPEIELANIVLQWDLRTEIGARAHKLARQILGKADPQDELYKHTMIAYILTRSTHMPRLEDLKKSLLAMDAEELRQRIKEIREDRVIRKDPGKVKVKKAKAKDSAQTALAKLLADMSDEEREAFLKELEG